MTQAYLVLSEVLGHLDLLEARGRVAQEAGEDGVVRWAAGLIQPRQAVRPRGQIAASRPLAAADPAGHVRRE